MPAPDLVRYFINHSEIKASDFDRFYDKIATDEGHIVWIGPILKSTGHGRFKYKTRGLPAHRWFYIATHPEFDQSLWVLHNCDRPDCIIHVRPGTRSDNMKDAYEAGTNTICNNHSHPGNENGTTKLSPRQVIEIIELKKKHSIFDIARAYRVSRSCLTAILYCDSWKWLKDRYYGDTQ